MLAHQHLSDNTDATSPTDQATILVIDDDPAMRAILSFSLTAFGYLVLAAGGGEEALEITRNHPEIRLIMLDVVMPGLSGKSLAEQLKTHLPESSVLFCSGHPAAAMIRHDVNTELEHFLQKPYRPPELKRKLEEMLTANAGTSRCPQPN
jgi:two-component system, cell cycle sensor histidine kinase and response regulator CckA